MPFATSATFAALASLTVPALTLGASNPMTCRPLVDFSEPQEFDRWRVVNDGVMGGLSSGQMRRDGEWMRYSGVINTNGGGFSSIRRPLERGALANAVALKFNHDSDGRAYKLLLRSSASYRGRRISFQAPIPAQGDGALVDLADLKGSLRGYAIPNARFERGEAVEIGIILADGRDGPFEMALRSIEICERAGTSV
ncbi:MAG: CIA30 family protein [Pseudomonadota bacterium]